MSSFYLQFSQDGRRWHTYKELVTDARPRAKVGCPARFVQLGESELRIDGQLLSIQVFPGNHDDQGVAESRLNRMVSAQFVRLLPHDFQNGIYLRLEIMGCGDGWWNVECCCMLLCSDGILKGFSLRSPRSPHSSDPHSPLHHLTSRGLQREGVPV